MRIGPLFTMPWLASESSCTTRSQRIFRVGFCVCVMSRSVIFLGNQPTPARRFAVLMAVLRTCIEFRNHQLWRKRKSPRSNTLFFLSPAACLDSVSLLCFSSNVKIAIEEQRQQQTHTHTQKTNKNAAQTTQEEMPALCGQCLARVRILWRVPSRAAAACGGLLNVCSPNADARIHSGPRMPHALVCCETVRFHSKGTIETLSSSKCRQHNGSDRA